MSDKFEYKYEAPTLQERKQIESIRSQYLPKDKYEEKVELLKSLDAKVKRIPTIIGLSLGIMGVLLFGICLTFFLEWTDYMFLGIPFGIVGVILMIMAYVMYRISKKTLQKKFGPQIIELANQLLEEK